MHYGYEFDYDNQINMILDAIPMRRWTKYDDSVHTKVIEQGYQSLGSISALY
jgi:hypothetical protein